MAGKSLPLLTAEIVNRFWAGVSTAPNQGPTGSCWEWQKGCNGENYGAIQIANGSRKTHRVAYKIYYGQDPEELLVCHTCDNTKCVNPFHLFLGTDEDNCRDRERKGRGRQQSGDRHGTHTKPESVRKGSENGSAKLTEEQVLDIRRRYRPRQAAALGREFGVSGVVIGGIVQRKSWTHI